MSSSQAYRQGEGPQSSSSRQASTSTSGDRSKKRTSGSSAGKDDAKMIGQWRIGRTIGKGSSGRVKIAKHAITGKYAAVKIVPKGLIISSRMSMSEAGARADKVLLGIEREIVIMKLIDHPNVLNLYDVWETSTELYLIMEYVPGGELFDYLVRRGRLPVSEALHYFQQIIHAVDYCHRFNICHRDLKPENLLLDKDKNIKVADFGMAAWEAGERMLETSCGSPHYASPEIVAGKAYHGSSSDIWSCGIILFALLTGRLPFDDDNIRSLLQKVKAGVFEMPDEIVDPARNLLKRMLEKDPAKRITMPDILTHPFFLSRPPRAIPGRSLVSPPSLNEVERPVSSAADIDPDIMGNLKTLWHGVSDDEIVAALMSKDKTWEKAIYHLLVKYRNKHLENYNMDDEEEAESRARKGRSGSQRQSGPSPAKRKGTQPAPTQARLTPLSENQTIQAQSTPPPARPAGPTPKKASGQAIEESPLKSKTAKVVARELPAGPRPPMSPRGGSQASTVTSPDAPAITLQEATPVKEMPPPAMVPARPQSQTLASSPISSEAPQLPPLNVPQVQDVQLQHFFNEVAMQLKTMNIRSSVASNSSTASEFSPIQAYMAYAAGQSSAPPPTPSLDASQDPNQFADADDDQTDAGSIRSGVEYARSYTSSPVPGQHAPLVGLGIGGPPAIPARGVRPGLYPIATQNQQRWSVASSGGSSQFRGASASSYAPTESPGLYSPNPNYGTDSYSMPTRSALPTPPQSIQATRAAPPRPVSAIRTESHLPRENSYIIIDHADMPASDPSLNSWGSKQSSFSMRGGQDAFGKLKKKKKMSIEPTPFSPNLSGPSSANSANSPKRSWFGNLFSFKPAPCTLLSHDNIGNTRDRTKKILIEYGVRVAIVEIDGLRALKCRLDEAKDLNGTAISKGVRFKVEFSRSTASTGSGYNTLVSLTQEKGAQSTFKTIFDHLQKSFSSSPPTQPTPILIPSTFKAPAPPSTPKQIHRLPVPPRIPAPQPQTLALPQSSPVPTSPHPPSSPRFGDAPRIPVTSGTSIRF